MNETQLFYDSYLAHHGIKGMKWGRRRWQNKDMSLTPAGIKRYAKKGYSQDAYNSNKSRAGKAYDKVTGAHKIAGSMRYDMSSDKERKARAEKYVADKNSKKQRTPEQIASRNRKLKIGATIAAGVFVAAGHSRTTKLLVGVGTAYVVDRAFYDGKGKQKISSATRDAGSKIASKYASMKVR